MKLNRDAAQNTNSDFPLLRPGTYDFEVENAEYVQAKSGKPQWKLTLRLEQENGPDVKVWDYLPEQENCIWKFNQFFDSVGLNSEDTDDTKKTIGDIGRCVVSIEKGKDGYPDRNRITRYLAKEAKAPAPKPSVNSDDLPF